MEHTGSICAYKSALCGIDIWSRTQKPATEGNSSQYLQRVTLHWGFIFSCVFVFGNPAL